MQESNASVAATTGEQRPGTRPAIPSDARIIVVERFQRPVLPEQIGPPDLFERLAEGLVRDLAMQLKGAAGIRAVEISPPSPETRVSTTKPGVTRQPSPSVVYVAADSASLRKGPGPGFTIVDNLWRGRQLRVLEDKDGWYRVMTEDSKEGWVEGLLTSSQPPPARGYVIAINAIPSTGASVRATTEPVMVGGFLGSTIAAMSAQPVIKVKTIISRTEAASQESSLSATFHVIILQVPGEKLVASYNFDETISWEADTKKAHAPALAQLAGCLREYILRPKPSDEKPCPIIGTQGLRRD